MKISNQKLIGFSIGFLLFIQLFPSFYWNYIGTFNPLLSLILVSLLWTQVKKISGLDSIFLFGFVAILVTASICKGSNVLGLIMFSLLSAIPFIKEKTFYSVYHYFKGIYSIVLMISIFVFALVLLGVPIPNERILPLNAVKDWSYFSYPLLVIPDVPAFSSTNYRFHGPFDEPGVVGTISLMMLFIDRFNLKNWKNIVIFISGIISFSLFFFVTAILYAIFTLKKKYSIILITMAAILGVYTYENEFLNAMLWNRLTWDENKGSFAGDNRSSSSLDDYYDQIKGTSTYYWGGTDSETLAKFSESASYKNAVLLYGFIPCFMYVIFFLLLAFKHMDIGKSFLIFAILLIGTLYQRPGFFYANFIFLFAMFIQVNKKRILKKISPQTMSISSEVI